MKYWRYIVAFLILGITLYVYFAPYIVEYNELAKNVPIHSPEARISTGHPAPGQAGRAPMDVGEPSDYSHLSNFALAINILALAAACVSTWLTFAVYRKVAGGALSYPWIALTCAAICFLASKGLWVLTTLRVIRGGFDPASFLELAFIGAFLTAAILQRRSLS